MKAIRGYLMTSVLVCVLMVLSFTITGCSREISSTNEDLSVRLDEYVNAFNEAYGSHKINGSIIIAKEGKIAASRSYGMADFESNIAFTQDTRSLLCSTTKLFTAIGIMQLNEKGLLTLDDKVSKHIPNQYRGDDISIRHLLTHTSGITRDVTDSGIMNPYQNTPKDKLVSLVNERHLIFEPGTNMSYSNAGYHLLAYIIEKASGVSFEEYMEKNILEPSGMKVSGLSASKEDINNLAIGYEYKYNRFNKKMSFDMSNVYGSGNMYSTTHDMYLFDKALREEKLLKKETLNKMTSDNTELGLNYGYGCFVGELKGHRWFGHAGNLSNGYLIASISGSNAYLTPFSETKFFDKANEMWEHAFETDGAGKVTSYVLRDPVDEIRMNKVE